MIGDDSDLRTPSQTVGPFFHYCLPWKGGADLIGPGESGTRPDLVPPGHDLLATVTRSTVPEGGVIELAGVVLDGAHQPVADALVEIWHADAHGRYPEPPAPGRVPANMAPFTGFGRCATDAQGRYWFRTIRPGRVATADGALQAPHIAVSLFARGLLDRLVTRIYFADDEANAHDPVLALVPPERRATLIAHAAQPGRWHHDIVLQGEGETVFFAL